MHAGYLWFGDWTFEDAQRLSDAPSRLPDRTTLVKTRQRWRRHGVFEKVMTHVVDQCIAAGLVKPDVQVGVDGTQVRANASIHSLQPIEAAPVVSLSEYLSELQRQDQQECPMEGTDKRQPPDPPASSRQQEKGLDSEEERAVREDFHGERFSNATHRSTTDPDARLYKKGRGQEAHLRYLVHNVTDVKSGVILSTEASMASGKAEREVSLRQLVLLGVHHSQIQIRTVCADKAYGTPKYLGTLLSRGMIPLVSLRTMTLEEIPTWKRKTNDPDRLTKRREQVRAVLTKNRARRIQADGRYREIQRLRIRCEHGFAEAKTAHGLDRARSRGLACMQEQAILTAIVQNLKRLCRWRRRRPRPQSSVLACRKAQMSEKLGSGMNVFSCGSQRQLPISLLPQLLRPAFSPHF